MIIFQIVGMDQIDQMDEIDEIDEIDEMNQIEQRSVVLFLRLKDLSKKVIHHEFVKVLQENVVSYSSVTRFYSAGKLFWA
jgi:hypothetical protein